MKANVNQLTLSLSTQQLDLTEPAFASKTAGKYSMYPNIARKLGEEDSSCRFKRFSAHFQQKQCCGIIPVASNGGSGSRYLLAYSFLRFMGMFNMSWHNIAFSNNYLLGVIPAGSSLECEFVCLPSYDCPSAAQFFLAVGDKESAPTTGAENYLLTLLPKVNIINFYYALIC